MKHAVEYSHRFLRFAGLSLSVAGVVLAQGCSSVDEWWARSQALQLGWTDARVTDAASDASAPEPSARTTTQTNATSTVPPTNGQADPRAVAPEEDGPDAAVAVADASLEGSVSASDAAVANGDAAVVGDAGADDAGDGGVTGPTITALWYWVPLYERMDLRGPKLGYLRAGGRVRVEPNVAGSGGGCARGWYRVLSGGYACLNRMTSLNPNELGSRTPLAPDLSQPMPYPYMTAYRAVPLYRWIPSEADMREVEPDRFGGSNNSAANSEPDAGATAPAPAAMGAHLPGNLNVLSTGVAAADAGASDGSSRAVATVTNRTQAADAGVRIEDLEGAEGTPLLRRVLSGMYLSVDREVNAGGRRFWRTQSGGFIERSAISALRNVPTFQGVVLDATHPLPVGFMTAFEGYTYTLSADGTSVSRRGPAPRLTVFSLTPDAPVRIRGADYYRTREGFYVSSRQVRMVRTSTPPADVGVNEKWIEVNLDRQMLIAYEGARPVYVTLVSTGRRNGQEEERNYETIQGAFRIQSKHIATTMDGNSAGDGPYSIEDVPWVMYFENSFALHGAFWHGYYGIMRSHGCVNLAPADARWIFHWTEPALPPGWHGVYANASQQGTRVYVHYEEQALGERGGPRVVPQH